jgi:hypothetical protein
VSHQCTKKTDELLFSNACRFEGYRWYMPSVCRVWRCDFLGSAYEEGHVTPMHAVNETTELKQYPSLCIEGGYPSQLVFDRDDDTYLHKIRSGVFAYVNNVPPSALFKQQITSTCFQHRSGIEDQGGICSTSGYSC